jgi:hypothetical protein
MGPEIIVPIVVLAVVVPVVLTWAKRNLKDAATGGAGSLEAVRTPSERLTSSALRELPSPPWRVVYEIAEDKLGGVEHVLIGPSGVYALQTSIDPLPAEPTPDAGAVAADAIRRGSLDDALRRCGLGSDRLLRVHWGSADDDRVAVEIHAGTIAVNGRRISDWAATAGDERLSPAQVELAWQTVTTAIGRPDPLA